jgi:hypothetical protein
LHVPGFVVEYRNHTVVAARFATLVAPRYAYESPMLDAAVVVTVGAVGVVNE